MARLQHKAANLRAVYSEPSYYEDDDGPGPFCAGAVIFMLFITGLYFLISSSDTTRADKLKDFDRHVSNWSTIHRKDFESTAFWVTSKIEFSGVYQEELSQLAPLQLVQSRDDESTKDTSADVPVFEPLSHRLPAEEAPAFIKAYNFSNVNLNASMPSITFFL
jgi:hypothetical protein